MLRFVILAHRTPPGYVRGDHWDFMLEAGGALRTWALENEPGGGKTIAAEALSDHRLDYLTYEGPISGGRGEVTRWDAGTYDALQVGKSVLRVRLAGHKLSGEARLERSEDQRWMISFSGGEATSG
jgi:hypothetical protein